MKLHLFSRCNTCYGAVIAPPPLLLREMCSIRPEEIETVLLCYFYSHSVASSSLVGKPLRRFSSHLINSALVPSWILVRWATLLWLQCRTSCDSSWHNVRMFRHVCPSRLKTTLSWCQTGAIRKSPKGIGYRKIDIFPVNGVSRTKNIVKYKKQLY